MKLKKYVKICNRRAFFFSLVIIFLAHLSTHNCTECISLQMFLAKVSSDEMVVIGSCYFQFPIPPPETCPSIPHSCTTNSHHTQAGSLKQLCPWPWIGSHEALQDRLLRSLLPGHQACLHGIIQPKIDKRFISRSIEKKEIDCRDD